VNKKIKNNGIIYLEISVGAMLVSCGTSEFTGTRFPRDDISQPIGCTENRAFILSFADANCN